MSKRVRILYMTQAGVAPPTFVLFTDRAVKLHFSYQRFLENQIREAFGFVGSPIWIKNRAREISPSLLSFTYGEAYSPAFIKRHSWQYRLTNLVSPIMCSLANGTSLLASEGSVLPILSE
jgi:hypothetical protein